MQWATAILKKDAAILERIWAPDFVDVAPSGERFSKADGIAAIKTGKRQPTRSELSSIDVRCMCNAKSDAAGIRQRQHRVAQTDRTRCQHSGCSRFAGTYASFQNWPAAR